MAHRLPVLVMPRERICIGLIGRVPGDSWNDDTGCAILEEIDACVVYYNSPVKGRFMETEIGG